MWRIGHGRILAQRNQNTDLIPTFANLNINKMAINIYPINDLKEHIFESTCDCLPNVIIENGEMIICHNSFDGREKNEMKKKVNKSIVGSLSQMRAINANKEMEKELLKLKQDVSFREYVGFEMCMNIFRKHYEKWIINKKKQMQ